ncbi:hypothetical protein LO762_27555 [Actinocorallia sp. API 0066]|uniref:hypothetical protein n=1 Tax=Actinocorallia sp. API 0066 TaxID=2896846 RepID=UPI001E5FFC8B|nr:hypothetical protein [Actinocorallia sp. API 0066]MCD0452908.1 hypothetical protein [Actinocorallia sp. API 0066]
MAAERTFNAERLAGILTAHISLAVAVLFYMGWAYTNAVHRYFQLNPLDLEIGVTEYVLRSSATVFSSLLIALAAGWLVVTGALRLRPSPPVWARRLVPERVARLLRRVVDLARSETALGRLGLVLLVGAAGLVALARAGVADPLYLALALTAAGAVLVTRAADAFHRALGLAVAAACALWAAGAYASQQGAAEAENIAAHLSERTAVVVYSAKPLGLSGPGVKDTPLPRGHAYSVRYTGLRLLFSRAGRYYLLPEGWRPGVNATFLIRESDGVRLEFLPGGRSG